MAMPSTWPGSASGHHRRRRFEPVGEAQPPADAPKAAPVHVHEVSPALARALFGGAPPWVKDFGDLSYEWRRLSAEFIGTFLLVVVAAGAGVIDATSHGTIGRAPSVVAPALMVMAVILAVGAISGAHLNPVVSVAFALRQEFPWRRIAGYVLAQVGGAVVAVLFLWAMFGKAGHLGANLPGPHTDHLHAMVMEILLTFGLVTTILGTASGAQNVGPLSALAVAGYIALAGLWSSPVSGASMNPVRSLAPDLFNGQIGSYWIYAVGPTVGMLVAVAVAWVLRGPGGDVTAARAAQGSLGVLVLNEKPHADDVDG
jgi:aquaporin Z